MQHIYDSVLGGFLFSLGRSPLFLLIVDKYYCSPPVHGFLKDYITGILNTWYQVDIYCIYFH